jgi:hypothetical protein
MDSQHLLLSYIESKALIDLIKDGFTSVGVLFTIIQIGKLIMIVKRWASNANDANQ